MQRVILFIGSVLVAFGMSLLIIPAVGISAGLIKKDMIIPIYEWATDPGPLYVDDPRCCR